MMNKREYDRAWAKRRRDRLWTEQAKDATHCPRMLVRGRPCRTPLQNRLVNGETVPFCPTCDLKSRAICVECRTAPVRGTPGRAILCAACAKLSQNAAHARFAKRHPGKVRAQWKRRKRRLQKDPIAYREMLEKKRLWGRANPKAKARYAKKYHGSEHAREYQRLRRLRIAQEKRDVEKERARLRKLGIVMTHPCVSCGGPITGRPKKCTPCRTRDYQHARAVLTGAAA